MTSIDDLFKSVNNTSSKRRLVDPSTESSYKSAKLSSNGSPANGLHPPPIVEDEKDEQDDDTEAGPAAPPAEDDYEEDEGRFFGGGVSAAQREALDFVDNAEDENGKIEVIDSAWLRKTALNFERKISKNAELRARYEGEATKFMASEADLDTTIKSLSLLSEHPELYSEFSALGCVNSLVSLLAHENTDIAIDAIEILAELTDEDIDVPQELLINSSQSPLKVMMDAMLDADVVNLLIQNLERLDETTEADRAGVYQVLNVFENLLSHAQGTTRIAEQIGTKSDLLPWLLKRIQIKEPRVGQNKQYAAEILAILLQSSSRNRLKLANLNGIDILLQLLSAYRKKDPVPASDEDEYAENLFDALTVMLDDEPGKHKFLDAEGTELCLIMLREGKMSKARALRVLDHALSGPGSIGLPCCEKFVEAAGLKTLFGLFVTKKRKQQQLERESMEHVLGIFASLLRLLPGNSAERIRLLAKFVEKDYEKISRLMTLRTEYVARLARADKEIAVEAAELEDAQEKEAMADAWLSRRYDAGLFALQTVDVILAWLVAEDDGARARVSALLKEGGSDLEVLRKSLREQRDGVGDVGEEGQLGTRDMLDALIVCL